MSTTIPKTNPIVELLEIPVMLLLDHFFLRRWFPPVVSAITAGAVVGLISGAFYLKAKKKPGLRFVLLLVFAVLLSLLLGW